MEDLPPTLTLLSSFYHCLPSGYSQSSMQPFTEHHLQNIPSAIRSFSPEFSSLLR